MSGLSRLHTTRGAPPTLNFRVGGMELEPLFAGPLCRTVVFFPNTGPPNKQRAHTHRSTLWRLEVQCNSRMEHFSSTTVLCTCVDSTYGSSTTVPLHMRRLQNGALFLYNGSSTVRMHVYVDYYNFWSSHNASTTNGASTAALGRATVPMRCPYGARTVPVTVPITVPIVISQ